MEQILIIEDDIGLNQGLCKALQSEDGKKMVQTIDDLYLSGQSEHVQFEQL
jgi:hypothetical protein